MEISYWLSRWEKGKTGFHADAVNEHLVKFWDSLGLLPDSVVFVPLCGMSLDMLWLAERGFKVVGVEASEMACRMFFEQTGQEYEIIARKGFQVYRGKDIAIWCGDFFKLKEKDLPEIRAVYDRAALVAMPADKRPLYAHKISRLMNNDVLMLLVSFTYPQDKMTGPPFSVPKMEVEHLFRSYEVRQLDSLDVLGKSKKYQKRGLPELHEISYLIRSPEGIEAG